MGEYIMKLELRKNPAYKQLVKREAHKLVADIEFVFDSVSPMLNEICIWFENYTLHDVAHSLRVLDNMCKIAGKNALLKLSDLELAMIIFSALLHDIGMWISEKEIVEIKKNSQYAFYLKKCNNNHKVALQNYIRPIHGERSYNFLINNADIRNHMFSPLLSRVNYLDDVALLCQSHMESLEWINNNLRENFSKGHQFNSKYIALLLRIADYIDFDSQRAPEFLFRQKVLNEISLVEWEKHATVCNLEKIDEIEKRIYFDIECHDFDLYCKLKDTIDSMDREISTSVSFSKNFKDKKYELIISDKLNLNIETIGFRAENFYFSLDYYKVTSLLMGENLYGDKRYGLRELLQNSFDACNLMSQIHKEYSPTMNYEPQISIIYDYDNNNVIIKDNGTGMSKDIINNYFLAIGVSYYRSDDFGKLGYNFSPTGTFGIGFLSCFMLSSRIGVQTKYYENAESSTFLLERGKKYICFEDGKFAGNHGTEIHINLNDFEKIFTKDSLVSFIKANFFELDTKIKVYSKMKSIIKFLFEIEGTSLLNGLDLDLSDFFAGAKCKASISSHLDDFRLHRNINELESDEYTYITFNSNGIEVIDFLNQNKYKKQSCAVIKSLTSLEDLINITYRQIKIGKNQYDTDIILDYINNYGFDIFKNDFDEFVLQEYIEQGYINDFDDEVNDTPWELSEEADNILPICVIWGSSFENMQLQKILHETKLKYFRTIGIISCSYDTDVQITDAPYDLKSGKTNLSNNMYRIVSSNNHDDIDEDTDNVDLNYYKPSKWSSWYENTTYSDVSDSYEFFTRSDVKELKRQDAEHDYEIDYNESESNSANDVTLVLKVCYRGVYLSDVRFSIPNISKLFITIFATLNVYSDDLIPSVTRTNLTQEQSKLVSYAIGRAIHLYYSTFGNHS